MTSIFKQKWEYEYLCIISLNALDMGGEEKKSYVTKMQTFDFFFKLPKYLNSAFSMGWGERNLKSQKRGHTQILYSMYLNSSDWKPFERTLIRTTENRKSSAHNYDHNWTLTYSKMTVFVETFREAAACH